MKLNRFHKQSGATLMEVLVAMTVSLIATAAMIALMSNTLGTTSRIVKMTKLADDMRVTMQMMTRDVRRANYNANAIYCYATDGCVLDSPDSTKTLSFDSVTLATLAGDVGFEDDDNDHFADDECFTFLTDRDQDGNSVADEPGAFRRRADPDTGVNAIEMWTGDGEPACNLAARSSDWVQITDPQVVDITGFDISDEESYTEVIQTDADGNPLLSQTARKLSISLRARLVLDPSIEREIVDLISLRNDVLL